MCLTSIKNPVNLNVFGEFKGSCWCVFVYVRAAFYVLTHIDPPQIQEEMEMWKMRGWQVQTSHHKHLSGTESVR